MGMKEETHRSRRMNNNVTFSLSYFFLFTHSYSRSFASFLLLSLFFSDLPVSLFYFSFWWSHHFFFVLCGDLIPLNVVIYRWFDFVLSETVIVLSESLSGVSVCLEIYRFLGFLRNKSLYCGECPEKWISFTCNHCEEEKTDQYWTMVRERLTFL